MRHDWKTTAFFFLCCASMMIAGCASVRSVAVTGTGNARGGLVYYLPLHRMKLTLTVSDDPKDAAHPRTVDVTSTEAFADTGHRYVAQYRRNQAGTNALKLNVNALGLLDSETTGSSTPNLSDLIGNFAAIGRSSIQGAVADDSTIGCTTAGTYEWIFDLPIDAATDRAMVACGMYVDAGSIGPQAENVHWTDTRGNAGGTGFFYRQKRPVQVSVSVVDPKNGVSHRKSSVFMIVDAHSPIEFLPVPRSVFAVSSWKLSFTNGTPTLYDVSTGGEVLGLVKLPAEVVSAYSKAIAAGFNDRKGIPVAEVEYLKQLNALALQQAKAEACRAAVATGDLDKIKAACQ